MQMQMKNWVIIEGEWEWWIDGVGTRKSEKNDIVCVPKGVLHQIKCIGNETGVRYAITKPDVDHTYQMMKMNNIKYNFSKSKSFSRWW